jgi:hypothetical protein
MQEWPVFRGEIEAPKLRDFTNGGCEGKPEERWEKGRRGNTNIFIMKCRKDGFDVFCLGSNKTRPRLPTTSTLYLLSDPAHMIPCPKSDADSLYGEREQSGKRVCGSHCTGRK